MAPMSPESEYPEVFPGRKGQYIIVEEAKGSLTVKYLSGEWKGQEVQMSKTVHENLQRNIKIDRTTRYEAEKEGIDDLLDLWYRKYPSLYNSLWRPNIQGSTLLAQLEEEYPEAGDTVREEESRW